MQAVYIMNDSLLQFLQNANFIEKTIHQIKAQMKGMSSIIGDRTTFNDEQKPNTV